MRPPHQRKTGLLLSFLAIFYSVWTLWAFLLVKYPDLDRSGVLRAAVRCLVWIIPVFMFVRWVEGPPILERLGMCHDARRGVVTGITGFAILFLLALARHGFGIPRVHLPDDLSTWLNPILTAPLAEELLFRGLVFRLLRERYRAPLAFVASALLFAMIHLPYWWMSGIHGGAGLVVEFVSMFVYGLFFAGLYHRSTSLWSPLICHWLNNLLTLSMRF